MKIREYLKEKYKVEVPTTITKVEAKVFSIPYPLRPKWLASHGEREIWPWQLREIKKRLQPRLDKQERRKKKKGAEITLRAIELTEKPIALKPLNPADNAFLQTYEWRRIRMLAIQKYGARCSCCGATPKDGVRMHVDHIKPRRFYPNLALDIDNLQVLCEVCNHGKGNWDMTDWRKTEGVE